MKTSIMLALFVISLTLLSATTRFADLTFTVTIQGAENKDVLKDGVEPGELTQLTIGTNDQTVVVHEFDIIHARGKSPLDSHPSVSGNTYDVSAFRKKAKQGDRIVVNVKSVMGPQNTPVAVKDVILQISIR